MNMTTTLIILALIAWCAQIILSWYQIRRFNHAFLAMKKGMYLGVGRNQTKRFKPRVLMALSIDHNHIIIDSVLMKGLTVFALPKPLQQLHGLSVDSIRPENIFPDDLACQSTLKVALTTNAS